MNIFAGLHPAQQEAVRQTEGPVRIIAGAGSGKTKTLTHRFAYLVQDAGIPAGSILCVTFTAKAAGEMKRRVRALVGDGCDTSLITTYHGFCVRVLREDIHRLFYPHSFAILDEGGQKQILSEIYAELGLRMDRATFESILDKIHRFKCDESYVTLLTGGDIPISPDIAGENVPDVEILHRYLRRQKLAFALDFDDLIACTFALFEQYPEVRQKWAERLFYIQVDEFQDSSRRELRLLSALSSVHGNLFVVGDPDQNIYEWRGADMAILLDFEKTFPGTRTIFLNRNYRSTGHILTCANTLIEKNKNRLEKALYTEDGAGEPVVHFHAVSEKEEARYLTETLTGLHDREKIPWRDMAILYRSSFLSRGVEQALLHARIPYVLTGGVPFTQRMEIRDTLSYLTLLVRDDDEALCRIVNTPRRGFGKAKLERLRTLAAEEGGSLFATLLRHRDEPFFAQSRAGALLDLLTELRARARDGVTTVSTLLDEVLTRSGYETYIRENGSMERLDNLAECRRAIVEREREWGEFYPLETYLQQIAVEAAADDLPENADRVRLMTIHTAKGLEFPVCCVVGMSEGIFPSARTLEERREAGLEEERRLCFVALTRAMRRLYLFDAEGSYTQGQRTAAKRPSRFLWDIGEENYTRVGVIPKELLPGAAAAGAENGGTDGLPVGSVVEHPVFGRGILIERDENARVYSILFAPPIGKRPVRMEYAFPSASAPAPDTPPSPTLPDTPPAPALPDVPPAPTPALPDVPPSPTLPDVPPAPALPDAPPSPSLPDVPPAPALPDTPPAPTLPDVPPSPTLPDVPPAPALPDVPPAPALPDTPPAPVPGDYPMRYRHADWANPPPGEEENLWKRDDVPHAGWQCDNIVDLGAPVGICRMCGHQIIRYVHIMRHPSYPRAIGAGCVCAGRMEGDPAAAERRENEFKKRQSRLETFLHQQRKRSRSGNEFFRYHGEIVTLFPDKHKPGWWKTAYQNRYSPAYATPAEALTALFDTIDPPAAPDSSADTAHENV